MRVLVVNAGSSSLKVSMVGPEDEVSGEHEFEATGGQVEGARLDAAIHAMGGVEAVGHRVVHGGARYPESVRIDAEVIRYLVTITDLAPLHIPASLTAMAEVRELMPRVPAAACLDTAFHSRLPAAASTYAIPLDGPPPFALRPYGVQRPPAPA